jgi:predicted DCC family thiol-disulfide oxidoreductase YuxK
VQSAIRISSPPPQPVIIFDGDCGFCRTWILRWERATGGKIEFIPYQSPEMATRFPELPRSQCETSVQLISTDGAVFFGAEAVFRALCENKRFTWLLWLYQRLWPFAACSEWAYRLVAGHRQFFSFLTRLLLGSHTAPPSHFLVRSVFLRSIGAIYLIAFVSLWVQVHPLVGSHGIIPAQDTMDSLARQSAAHGIGLNRFHLAPTLCWLSGSDRFLSFLCASGSLLGLLVLIGLAPLPCLALLWCLYLSLAVVSREFLGFQWDNLLLETGFLAIFFAPASFRLKSAIAAPPSRIVLWLLRWLLFRLMFESGVVKLSSKDATWHGLTALQYHYETQPLPTWFGWFAHQLPAWAQKSSTLVMFFIELVVPFLIFVPGRLRRYACVLLLGFQFLIMLTGNYCFFNLLTMALCVLLLDDLDLARLLPARWRMERGTAKPRPRPLLRLAATVPLAMLVALSSVIQYAGTFRRPVDYPRWMVSTYVWLSPFRTFNNYGLFAVMTTNRREIVVEGSNDGIHWQPYEFKYKPGRLNRRPAFVEPHQPRLDWQMWFAALGSYRQNPWFLNFCMRVLQGSPEVLSLLERNPFPARPPRYLRAVSYDYHFTDWQTLRTTGAWWRRDPDVDYLPMISLEGGH